MQICVSVLFCVLVTCANYCLCLPIPIPSLKNFRPQSPLRTFHLITIHYPQLWANGKKAGHRAWIWKNKQTVSLRFGVLTQCQRQTQQTKTEPPEQYYIEVVVCYVAWRAIQFRVLLSFALFWQRYKKCPLQILSDRIRGNQRKINKVEKTERLICIEPSALPMFSVLVQFNT